MRKKCPLVQESKKGGDAIIRGMRWVMSDSLVQRTGVRFSFHVQSIYRRRNAELKATRAATADEAARPRAPEELPLAAAAVPAGEDAAELAADAGVEEADDASLTWGMVAKSWGTIIGAPETPRLTEPSSWR